MGILAMDLWEKVEALAQDARFEECGASDEIQPAWGGLRDCITPTPLPNGRVEPHLKVLLSNVCERDCAYCANRYPRDFRRATFRPDELAKLFRGMVDARLVTGLFLSSAVRGGPAATMEREIATVELLRGKYDFRGYIHLKLMPGVDRETVERAVELADRVSINLEAPSPERLARLSGSKDFYGELMAPLRWVTEIRERRGREILPLGHTTQLVVGASGESDQEILSTTSKLYAQLRLARVFYSAFRPVPDTPLEGLPPTQPARERRLYQSDFLLKSYGFQLEELVFDQQGFLPADGDPKMLSALSREDRFPVEINTASREQLLRVPGIGPRSAERILQLRRERRFGTLSDLKAAGASVHRAAPFVLLKGKRPPYQPRLF